VLVSDEEGNGSASDVDEPPVESSVASAEVVSAGGVFPRGGKTPQAQRAQDRSPAPVDSLPRRHESPVGSRVNALLRFSKNSSPAGSGGSSIASTPVGVRVNEIPSGT
jgi:hypothetical protein